ncbi:MAG: hypothetical protein HY918_00380 [Candidatus Doudnabacteria bacterium]|nr:hypothetical protein [Candidatus Doudnabacteria bacterium]
MNSLKDIINLAKADGGKFFVIDETGETQLVILPLAEYQRLLLGKLQKQILDVEKINREILNAQLQEEAPVSPAPSVPEAAVKGPVIISERAFPRVDLRAEVIDPSFDFEGPKMDMEDL